MAYNKYGMDTNIPHGEIEFRRIADSLPTLCWIADETGYLVWYNQRWHDYCGTTAEEMEGWGWTAVHDPEVLPSVMENWEKSIATGNPFEMTFPLKGKDGSFRPFLTRIVPIRDTEGRVTRWLGVNIDVTEQLRIEKELRESEEALRLLNQTLEVRVEERAVALKRAEEQLRQSQKMEAVGQMTGGLAHDFNNLLTGIMGNLELMQMRLQQNKFQDLDRFVTSARAAGTRAAALTQRLLAFSRRQTLDPRPTQINDLILGMEEMIQRTIGPEIRLNIHGDLKLGVANVDAGQLENSLLNLCINARDAMPAGGEITITTRNTMVNHVMADALEVKPGPYLEIRVLDSGCGMDADTASKAFDPFFTTKPIGQGTGLGLSMIYGFCRQSRGHVSIDSEVGQGTTITLYLPRWEGAGNQATHPDAEAPAVVDNGLNILLVDDEETIRYLAIEVLEDEDFRVIGAADGLEALRVLRSDAHLDLLITDVGLPNGMNGRQVADAARNLRPNLPVLFITGYAEKTVFGDNNLDPGMELLTKPFALDDLVKRVRKMLA